MKGVDGHREASPQRRAGRREGERGRGRIVQRMGRRANNNNNYESMGRRGKTGRELTRVRNICNGLFYSSDLPATAELMAAEISCGNETIGTKSATRYGEREE